MVTACDRDDCTCAVRCISCNFHFVKIPNSLCTVCAPVPCFNCHREISTEEKVYVLPGDLIKAKDFNYSYKGTCALCNKQVKVNSRSVCFDCQSHDKIVCEDCSKEKVCINCGKLHYNRGAYCSTCKEDIVLCSNCRTNEFIPTKGQIVCPKCFHKCVGCGNKFSPNSKKDTFCLSCLSKMDSGRCVSCGTSDHLDANGKCRTCSGIQWDLIDSHNDTYYCVVCKKRRVDYPNGTCFECQTEYNDCPSCSNVKKLSEYVCGKCKRANSV